MRVTPAQKRVLSAIQELTEGQGYVPNYRELSENLGVTRQAIHQHVEALVDRGYIRKTYGSSNSIEILEGV